jgi:hypothetical protein
MAGYERISESGVALGEGRFSLDASSCPDVMDALARHRPQLVVGCAAYTDVARREAHPSLAWAGNVDTARATAEACLRLRVPFLYVSSDYALCAGDRGREVRWDAEGEAEARGLVYSASKRAGEDEVLSRGGLVVRVAHLDPAKAKSYSWVNGYSLANREWTEDCAERLAELCVFFAHAGPPADPPADRARREPPIHRRRLHHDHAVEHPPVRRVMQRRQPMRQPPDGVALATAG